MVRYRRRLEIIADMLKVAERGAASKTKIMYGAGLSHGLLKKYLRDITNLGFIQINSKNNYELTEKGRIFLEKYVNFSSKYMKIESELESLRFEKEILEAMCRQNVHFNPKQIAKSKKAGEIV